MSSPNSAFPSKQGLPEKDSFVNLFINSKADFAPSETTTSHSPLDNVVASDVSMMGTASTLSYSIVSDSVASQGNSETTYPGVEQASFLRIPLRPALLMKPLDAEMQTLPLAALASPKRAALDPADSYFGIPLTGGSSNGQQQQQQHQVGASQRALPLGHVPQDDLLTKHESSSSLLDMLNSPPPLSHQEAGAASEAIRTWAAVQHDLVHPGNHSLTMPPASRHHRDRPPSPASSANNQPSDPLWTLPALGPSSSLAAAAQRSSSPDGASPRGRTTSPSYPNQAPAPVPLLSGTTPPRDQGEYQLSASPPLMTPTQPEGDNNTDSGSEEDDEERNADANPASSGPAEKPNPRKKKKNIYPVEARRILSNYFQHISRNPTKAERLELVNLVGSTEKTIRIWFQNQRQKLAKMERRRLARINGLQPTLADLTAPGMPILPAPPKDPSMSMDSLQSGNFLQSATPSMYQQHGSLVGMPPPPTPGLPMPPPPTPGFPMPGNTLSSSQMQLQQLQQQHLHQHFAQQQQPQQGITYVTRAGIISPITPTFLQNQAAAAAAAAAAHAQHAHQPQGPSQGHFLDLRHSNFHTGQSGYVPTTAASISPTRGLGVSPPLMSPALHGPTMASHMGLGQAYPSPDFVPSGSVPPPTPPANMLAHHPVAHAAHVAAPHMYFPGMPDTATPHIMTASPSPHVLVGNVSALGFASAPPAAANVPVVGSSWTPSPPVPGPAGGDYFSLQAGAGGGGSLPGMDAYVEPQGADWTSYGGDGLSSLSSSNVSLVPLGVAASGAPAGSKLAHHVMSFSGGIESEMGANHGGQAVSDQHSGFLGHVQPRVQGPDTRGHMQ